MLLFNVEDILRWCVRVFWRACVCLCFPLLWEWSTAGRIWRLLAVRYGNSVSVGKTVTCSMVQSPSCDAGQEIECLLWNPAVHYHLHNSTPLVPAQSQFSMSLSSMLTLFFRLYLNLPSVLFPSVLPTRNLIALLRAALQANYCKLKTRINLNYI